MMVIVGWLIVLGATLGGYTYSGGKLHALVVWGEYMIILGVALGYLVAASPVSMLKEIVGTVLTALKGSPYSKNVYLDGIKPLYELFQVAREQGVVGIEEDVVNPENSAIFKKYPSFLHNHAAISFMQETLGPVIDGRAKPDQLKKAMDQAIARRKHHHHKVELLLMRVADALPGIGIVAAVLGIIITMNYIAGDKSTIGVKVAHALVGTFLGILVSYGFLQPLVSSIEFNNDDDISYFEAIGTVIVNYAEGAPPLMAAEAGRRVIPHDRQPTASELEEMLKSLSGKG